MPKPVMPSKKICLRTGGFKPLRIVIQDDVWVMTLFEAVSKIFLILFIYGRKGGLFLSPAADCV
jgi:hypothetical protein